MRYARLLAVTVLVLVAVALPIQSAFAALTLDINPNPVVLGGSITFSGTGATPGAQISVGIWPSGQCAGSPQTGANGNADNSGNYQITFSPSLPVGQWDAQTASNEPLLPKSPCVAFTVVEALPTTVVEVPWSICVVQVGLVQQDGSTEWIGTGVTGAPISQCQNKTEVFQDVLDQTIMIHQFILNGTSFKMVPIQFDST
jgi:hypothetical protein